MLPSPATLIDPQGLAQGHHRSTMARIQDLLENGFPLMSFPTDLEQAFLQDRLPARARHFLVSGLISLLIYNGFLLADFLMARDVFWLAAQLRLLVFTPIALGSLYLFHKGIHPFRGLFPLAMVDVLALLGGIGAAASLGIVLPLSESPMVHFYPVGFMVVITYGNIVQRMRFWYAVAFSLILLTLHVVGVWALPSFPERMMMPLMSMVLASAAFTLTANYALENDERRRFLLTERERGLIRSLTQTQVRLRELSRVDELTGLYNRRHFESAMQQLWQRASFGRTPMAILMIDVDHFKKFNDHYGHPAGDACLRQVCQVMKQTLTGQGVIVARFGGEEFIAAIPGLDEDATLALAEQVRAHVERCQIPHERSATSTVVTASLGLAWCEARPEMKVEHLLALADGALYDAKYQGRNRVCNQST